MFSARELIINKTAHKKNVWKKIQKWTRPHHQQSGYLHKPPPPQLPCRASLARFSSCSFWASWTRSSVAESTSAEQPPWVSSRSLLSMSFICRSRLTSSCSWATSSRSRTAMRQTGTKQICFTAGALGWHTGRGPGLQANTLSFSSDLRHDEGGIYTALTGTWLAVAPSLPPNFCFPQGSLTTYFWLGATPEWLSRMKLKCKRCY